MSGARYISLFPLVHEGHGSGSPLFPRPRGQNPLDGGAPFYDVYTCSDGRWMSVGCMEPQFFQTFISRFIEGLDPDFPLEWRPSLQTRMNREEWPKLRKFLVDGFRQNTRDYWAKIFHSEWPIIDAARMRGRLVTDCRNQDTDSCAVPVLSPSEAAELSSEVPLPHPSLSRTCPRKVAEPSNRPLSFLLTGEHTEEILDEFGIVASEKATLVAEGALGTKRSKL